MQPHLYIHGADERGPGCTTFHVGTVTQSPTPTATAGDGSRGTSRSPRLVDTPAMRRPTSPPKADDTLKWTLSWDLPTGDERASTRCQVFNSEGDGGPATCRTTIPRQVDRPATADATSHKVTGLTNGTELHLPECAPLTAASRATASDGHHHGHAASGRHRTPSFGQPDDHCRPELHARTRPSPRWDPAHQRLRAGQRARCAYQA